MWLHILLFYNIVMTDDVPIYITNFITNEFAFVKNKKIQQCCNVVLVYVSYIIEWR
jgi:hypothetical protein